MNVSIYLQANAKKNKKKRKKQDEGEHVVDGAPYIDPNEPVYCYCKQISFGAMVACENQDCPIEWFHFPCVNLIEAVSFFSSELVSF